MRKINHALLLSGLVVMTNVATTASAAEGPESRLCNLQAREIALRINEEVAGNLNTEERGRIVAIAEEVCRDYQSAGMGNRNHGNTDMGRAEEARNQGVPAGETALSDQAEDTESEDNDGILGGLRIIEPEDRVRRPGLKRR